MTYNTRKFLIICLVLSVAPVIFTGVWQYAGHAKPTLQQGRLVQSSLVIKMPSAHNAPPKWFLGRVANLSCDATCQGQMYLLERLRLATGKDQLRVKTGLIAMRPIHSRETIVLSQDKMRQVRSQLKQDELLILDPRGQVVMSYPGNVDPRKISKDLKKLLKFSRLG